ncbi:hypothetical protein BJ322DRAFT_1105619 [Thelephora terrestris]|uniref:NACHT domain-containing protein n=1 Tax=Thelephora terrestris TaxID=56493 RepID=A0A9P6HPB7_9AGAM|nr:hypothetical protein BJ322DRAFT_1105619 [Thelephora terrestris]
MSFQLTFLQDAMANKRDYVGVCAVIDRALEGRPSDRTSRPVLEAVEKLTTTVAATSRGSVGNAKWKPSRLFNKKDNGDAIAGGEHDPIGATQALKMALLMSNNTMLSDLRHDTLAALECIGQSQRSPQTSAHDGELPPPAPRAFFGRGELVDKVVGFAQNLQHFALIGAAGIGKTSIALKVLHDDRVSKRFGSNRRFIRCDQFPASCPHFLARLSEVIGAGIENPKDMTPLRPRLSSEDMFIVLDNAESLLDPQATNHQEIYAAVHELFQFENIWLCITSRITTTPRYCERLYVPPLSKEAACNIFYGIYSDGERSVTIDDLLRRLDFHALSITVLATAAVENTWNSERLANQWEEQRAQVLRTDHHESFAATIELSLASPTFCSLGPTARDLLGVVAFFPQGIEEKNLDWLFPTIPDRRRIFDKFCVLSLTYRCNGFITMLAPIRDYLCPREPKSSPLLCATKDSYFTRLSAGSNTNEPRLKETRWIVSEDVNVEHLLDVFASTDGDEVSWNACIDFINHLHRQKPRHTGGKGSLTQWLHCDYIVIF